MDLGIEILEHKIERTYVKRSIRSSTLTCVIVLSIGLAFFGGMYYFGEPSVTDTKILLLISAIYSGIVTSICLGIIYNQVRANPFSYKVSLVKKDLYAQYDLDQIRDTELKDYVKKAIKYRLGLTRNLLWEQESAQRERTERFARALDTLIRGLYLHALRIDFYQRNNYIEEQRNLTYWQETRRKKIDYLTKGIKYYYLDQMVDGKVKKVRHERDLTEPEKRDIHKFLDHLDEQITEVDKVLAPFKASIQLAKDRVKRVAENIGQIHQGTIDMGLLHQNNAVKYVRLEEESIELVNELDDQLLGMDDTYRK